MSVHAKKGDWIVKMRCVVNKEVYCVGCTQEQARASPWDFAETEIETDQEDWDVLSVEPNK